LLETFQHTVFGWMLPGPRGRRRGAGRATDATASRRHQHFNGTETQYRTVDFAACGRPATGGSSRVLVTVGMSPEGAVLCWADDQRWTRGAVVALTRAYGLRSA
jgi:hypothetical protein